MLSKPQRQFADRISEIINCNPFLPDRIELERLALGSEFVESGASWNSHPSQHKESPNLERMLHRAEEILESASTSGSTRIAINDEELDLYLDLVRFVLFNRYRDELRALTTDNRKPAAAYAKFRDDWLKYCPPDQVPEEVTATIPHIFALLSQIRRAFNNIFENLIGSSDVIIELRAHVWQSIFTHDVRRYYSAMFMAMADFPTLITGPTGSGKELVARAIGQSGYVPFDPDTGKWETPIDKLFVSLNLSALSPTLIESELFGHTKGAFTGATSDRIGWLEACPKYGAVFLDEIGELAPEIQVKLLRVVQDRTFQPLGDTRAKQFQGRIIAATNRDLAQEIQNERFRLDFYYRLCADQIVTPSLAERWAKDKSEIRHLVDHLLLRIIPKNQQADLADECIAWIHQHLGSQYAWPGNVRELDQCLRSWLIRKDYQPLERPANDSCNVGAALSGANMTADELTSLYCKISYERTGSYVKTADQLGLDRRTVKARVHPAEKSE